MTPQLNNAIANQAGNFQYGGYFNVFDPGYFRSWECCSLTLDGFTFRGRIQGQNSIGARRSGGCPGISLGNGPSGNLTACLQLAAAGAWHCPSSDPFSVLQEFTYGLGLPSSIGWYGPVVKTSRCGSSVILPRQPVFDSRYRQSSFLTSVELLELMFLVLTISGVGASCVAPSSQNSFARTFLKKTLLAGPLKHMHQLFVLVQFSMHSSPIPFTTFNFIHLFISAHPPHPYSVGAH